MKKGLIFIIISVIAFGACIVIMEPKSEKKQDDNKIQIVATLFPQYDFAKKIGGDKINVSLLLTPGTETHTYEPTPQDIIRINDSDLFIYTGKYMEPWADRIISGVDSDTKILDASNNINLIKSEDDDEDEEEHEHEHEEHHHHEFDPHIWLNPQNAIVMVKNITDELCSIDRDNEEYYKANSEKLIKEINSLDLDIENTIKSSDKNKIAFGGTFAYSYFVNRYNLEYVTAYDSCGESAEPSVARVKEVIDYMKENNIKVVFYQEASSGKIADSIAKETGAQKLVFHTIHNATQEEINNGETYISLMRKNLENLKQALE
ncbi:MAG: zinc ABC transporter substrate-binding protein [Clostridia bacterium]|nr:zinc ABC transporter substrate-binding protein [Clostridia bacterium]